MIKIKSVCPNCLFVGKPEAPPSGCWTAIFLWILTLIFGALFFPLGLLFLVLAIIFSVKASITKAPHCPKCGAENMVPEDTPRGKELLMKNGAVITGEEG